MKFWQKKKTFEVSETDQVYKVIYLGNVVTSWAKGEHTLDKPISVLWRNYCNNYANHIKNNDNKKRQVQNKQILMKLTICNQGLKALTREFGLTEYWANRICFCGQNHQFPRVFAWIYRHEAKQKKQELRVHACFVNSQSNVNKMISTLQQKVNFALNEFKREKRLKENARRILSMNESLNLDDDEIEQDDKTDSKFFNDFVDRLYNKMNDQSKLKDDLSINSSEQMNYESANTSKNSTLDSKRITRNPSQGSLNSIKSKSSTSSKKSINYDSNLIPVRRQFLLKGLKNFKEPIERSRSAPKLSSISEEFIQSSDEEESFFSSQQFNMLNNNFVNYYNIIEDEPDDEEIIRELGLINNLANQEINDEIINENDKTLTEFNENVLNDHHFDHYDQEFKKLSSTIYEEENEHQSNNHQLDTSNSDHSSSFNENIEHSTIGNRKLKDSSSLSNGESKTDSANSDDQSEIRFKIDVKQIDEKIDQFINQTPINRDDQLNDDLLNKVTINQQINNQTKTDQLTKELKETFVYSSCQSPQFIIFKRTNSFNNRDCDLHAKQILEIQENCKLIEDLVLNF